MFTSIPTHPCSAPRLDGSKVLKVLLDPKDRNSAEYKVRLSLH